MSKPQRLFVGNLPENVIDQELKNEFSSYGRVKDVELKHKRNADEEIINTFAFIQIDIDGQSLRQCLQEFKTEKFKGRFLTVTVARENFLDKLKREREEAAARTGSAAPAVKETPIELVATRPALPVLPVSLATRSTNAADSSSSEDSSSSSESEDEDARTPAAQVRRAAAARPAVPAIPDQEVDEDGNLLLRKRSKTFLENGRIRIDASSGTGAGALHVIERHGGGSGKEPKKQLVDDKSKEADKKRIESLGKMKDTYNQQKLAIKQALSGIDASGGQRSNKIVFDAEPAAQQQRSAAKRTPAPVKGAPGRPLFDEEDDDGEAPDYSNDFRVKEQYQGERGAQLLKLQSRFKNDKRFDMDAKFLEDGGDYDGYEEAGEEQATAVAADGDDERKWQYGILESVMGKRIQSDPVGDSRRNQLPQTMLRYDPTKQDHTKYLAQGKRRADDGGNEGKAKKSKQNAAAAAAEEAPARSEFEVSKEKFYKVNTNLNSLTGGGAGFSLLSMFGTAEPTTIGKNAAYRETLLTANNAQRQIDDMTNPFKYDESEDEQVVPNPAQKLKTEADATAKKAAVGKVMPKKGTTAVWHETFFILDAEDERMKDGLAFFLSGGSPVNELDLENRQKEMRHVLKKKVKRSIKSALPHGAKPNRGFRKFVRHL